MCCLKQPRARTRSCKKLYYVAESCGVTPKGDSVVFSLQSSRCPPKTPEASLHSGSHILMASSQETVAAARVFGMRRQCDGAALCCTEQHVVTSATLSPRMSFHHFVKQRPPLPPLEGAHVRMVHPAMPFVAASMWSGGFFAQPNSASLAPLSLAESSVESHTDHRIY